MASVLYATNRYPGNGSTTVFTVAFSGGYLDKSHVKAFITDSVGLRTDIVLTSDMWVNATTLDIGTPVPVGSTLTIRRETPKVGPLVDYTNGTRLTEGNLDLGNKQSVFIGAEAHDLFDTSGVEEAVAEAVSGVATLVAAAGAAADDAAASAGTAGSAASAASASAGTAASAAALALTRQLDAEAAALVADGFAQDSAASAASAAATAAALAGGTVGFDASAYDFGLVADTTTYFNRDFGTL